MDKIYFATGNEEKAREAQAILKIPIEVVNIEVDEVQSMDLEYVAKKKAEAVFNILRKPVIVDDVSLEIDALNNFPGPLIKYLYSSIGNDGILKLLENENNRKVKIKNAIGYADRENIHVFVGVRNATIAEEISGIDGWGFDPIMIPEGETKTIASLGFEHKNNNSHRSISLKMFKEFLDSQRI